MHKVICYTGKCVAVVSASLQKGFVWIHPRVCLNEIIL